MPKLLLNILLSIEQLINEFLMAVNEPPPSSLNENMKNECPEMKSCLVCSTGHMMLEDMRIFQEHSQKTINKFFNTVYGFILLLDARPKLLKSLKKLGISNEFRKFIYRIVRQYRVSMIEFDRDADVILGEKFFDW